MHRRDDFATAGAITAAAAAAVIGFGAKAASGGSAAGPAPSVGPALHWTALVSVAAVGFLTIVRVLAPRRVIAPSTDAQSTERSSAPTQPTRAAQLKAVRQQLDDARTNDHAQARVPVGAVSRSPGAPDQVGSDAIDWTP